MLKWTQMDKAMNRVYGYSRGLNVRVKTFLVAYLTFFTAILIIDVTTYMGNFKTADGSTDIAAYILNLSPYSSAKYTLYSYIAGIISFVSTCVIQTLLPSL